MLLKRIRLLHHIFLTFTLFFLMSVSFFPFLRVSSPLNDSYQLISSNGTVDYPPPSGPPLSGWPFWSNDSYWRQKIPLNAPLHTDSAAMASWLVNHHGQNGPYLNYVSYTKPIYNAYEDTPKVTVYKSDKITPYFYNVPIASGWEPATDSDHGLSVIDWYSWEYYDFWQIHHEGSKWWAKAGYKYDLSQSGVAPREQWTIGSASIPFLMAIRDEEIEAGVINHPLICALYYPKKNYYVWPPAARTHGQTTDTYAVPDGARIQLNPDLDLDSLGLSRTAKIIAKALQEWGMVVKEEAGGWRLYCEHELSVTGGWSKWGLSGGIVALAAFKDQWRIVDYGVFSNEGVAGALYYLEY